MAQTRPLNIFTLSLLVFSVISLVTPSFSESSASEVKIGVLAYRGKDEAVRMWSRTASYLSAAVPGENFVIVPLDFQEIGGAAGAGKVDFVIANSSIYVELEAQYGVNRIATLKNRRSGHSYTVFGGVIFCRNDRSDIRALKDIAGRKFMAVEETSLGGWRTAWREFRTAGIDPYINFSGLLFGHTHDEVVYAVRDGKVDAGSVRTDTIERMAEEGKINPADFRVLNMKKFEGFPFACSTRLYPEWPFAKVRHTSDDLARQVAVALLNMPPASSAASDAKIEGWTIPLDYQPVHELMRELRLGPYRDYGKIPLSDAVRQYWKCAASATLALLIMTLVIAYVTRLNRVLHQSRAELEKSRNQLEVKVWERTADLKKTNEELAQEVIERRAAEALRFQSEQDWEETFNTITDIITIHDRDFNIIRANAAARKALGLPTPGTSAVKCYEYYHGKEGPADGCVTCRSLKTGKPSKIEFFEPHLKMFAEISAIPRLDSDNNVVGLIHIVRNITDRKKNEEELQSYRVHLADMVNARTGELISANERLQQEIAERRNAQEALRESEAKLRTAINSVPFDFWMCDASGRYSMQNPTSVRLWGDVTGKLPEELGVSEEILSIWQENNRRAFSGEMVSGEVRLSLPDGERVFHNSIIPIRDSGKIMGILGINIDITERKKMEEHLVKTEKLESLGILAGGIAHDFNNLLLAMLSNISLARIHSGPEGKAAEILGEAEKACLRAKHLTQQLLTFSKGGEPLKKTLSPAALIRESAEFAVRGSNVGCEYSFQEGLWSVEADEGQLGQVINNLIINAEHAMPDGGTIRITGENISVTAETAAPLKEGRYVKISITDHGVGIPEKHIRKIFDPYFSTKKRGSGLGLTTSYSIISRHGGFLTVESGPGSGSTFTVFLPAAELDIPFPAAGNKRLLSGTGRVLVMEDEEIIRIIMGRMLDELGYEPAFAVNGEEAIEIYGRAKAEGSPFDVVLVDLTIRGGMGGTECMRRLLVQDPGVKAIVSSGYSDDPIMSNYNDFGFKGIITKPYQIEDLGEILNKVLGTAKA